MHLPICGPYYRDKIGALRWWPCGLMIRASPGHERPSKLDVNRDIGGEK